MNATALPPLPSYTLKPQPPLVHGIPDAYLSLALLIIAYWGVSLFFHLIDTFDLFPQYRLHTPEEVLKRNHVSRYEVFRDVIIQQVVQTAFGAALTLIDPEPTIGREEYDIAVWATRIRIAQGAVPALLSIVGVNASALASKTSSTSPILAGIIAGGKYPMEIPAFMSWETTAARLVYHALIPAAQFMAAICIVDTWQYFWHRAMHLNKWLYTQFHSRHHRLYVPYAYGALYNHPVEGFILDTLGAGIAYLVTGMTVRQGMVFFTCSTIKTVDDHCGYALPFDPLQKLTTNNAGYHDIHHQSWGIKTNFSQPFFTFWDGLMGTKFNGDTSLRYERDRKAAERRTAMQQKAVEAKVDAITHDSAKQAPIHSTASVSAPAPLIEVAPPVVADAPAVRRSPRKKAPSLSSGSPLESIKELRNRMNTSLHGRGSGVLGVESGH